MKRKIIKQANQAYTLTLPIDWVRKNNLSEKSEVDVVEVEKELIISNFGRVESKSAKLTLSGVDEIEIIKQINALYARGVDEITITSDKDLSRVILEGLNQTMGYAIVSQAENKWIVKDITGGNYSNLDEIFKRVYQMILSFYDSAIKDVFGEEKETLKQLWARDVEINKFCLYLQRAINKMALQDLIKGRFLFTYSFELEQIGDEIERFWSANIETKIKKNDKLKKMAEISFDALSKSFELYYQFNPEKSMEIRKLKWEIRKLSSSLQKIDYPSSLLAKNILKIAESASDLSLLVLMIKL